MNRIYIRCQIWDHHTRQESGSEVFLKFIPEWGNRCVYCSSKPAILKRCLRIRYINWISLEQYFYRRMIREIQYSAGLVSGESKNWQRLSGAVDWKLYNIFDSENISNPFVTLVSGVPEIDKQWIIGIKLSGSGVPENMNLIRRL